MTDQKEVFVFVYGTLKNPTDEATKVVSDAVTVEGYLMFDGGFPLVVEGPRPHEANSVGYVKGQLLKTTPDRLQYMDRYEGTSPDNDPQASFYYRKLVNVKTPDIETEAWMYFGGTAARDIPFRDVMCPDDQGILEWNYQ